MQLKKLYLSAVIFSIGFIETVLSQLKLAPNDSVVERYTGNDYAVLCEGNYPVLRWHYPNNTIIGGSDPRYNVHSSTRGKKHELYLMFRDIKEHNNGTYTCVGRGIDPDEQIPSTVVFTLRVLRPISFHNEEKILAVEAHGNALLSCKEDGEPKPQVTWRFDGHSLEGAKYAYEGNALRISDVTREDVGRYICTAFQSTEKTSDVQDDYVDLVLFEAPEISFSYANDTAYGCLSCAVDLLCEVSAYPSASFTWKRDRQILSTDGDAPFTTISTKNKSILRILIMDDSFFGEYECEASNYMGTSRKILELRKGARPEAPKIIMREIFDSSAQIDILESPNSTATYFKIEFSSNTSLRLDDPWENRNLEVFQKDESSNAPYLLSKLTPSTQYIIRAGACTEIELCAFGEQETFRTVASPTNNSASSTLSRCFICAVCIAMFATLFQY